MSILKPQMAISISLFVFFGSCTMILKSISPEDTKKNKAQVSVIKDSDCTLLPIIKSAAQNNQDTILNLCNTILNRGGKALPVAYILHILPKIIDEFNAISGVLDSDDGYVKTLKSTLNALRYIKNNLATNKGDLTDSGLLYEALDKIFSEIPEDFDVFLIKSVTPIACGEGIRQISVRIGETVDTIESKIDELHVTMESKLDLIDSKIDALEVGTCDLTTIDSKIDELHVTMESKLDLIDSKIEALDCGSCDLTTIESKLATIDSKLDTRIGNLDDPSGDICIADADVDGTEKSVIGWLKAIFKHVNPYEECGITCTHMTCP